MCAAFCLLPVISTALFSVLAKAFFFLSAVFSSCQPPRRGRQRFGDHVRPRRWPLGPQSRCVCPCLAPQPALRPPNGALPAPPRRIVFAAAQSSSRCGQHAALRLTRRSLCAQALATPSRAAARSAARVVAAAGAAAAAGVVAGGAKVRSNCRRRQPAPLRCPADRAMAGALTGRGRGEGRERTPVSRATLHSRLAGRKTDTVCAEPVRGLPVRAQRAACPGRGRERRHAGHARQPLGRLGPPHTPPIRRRTSLKRSPAR